MAICDFKETVTAALPIIGTTAVHCTNKATYCTRQHATDIDFFVAPGFIALGVVSVYTRDDLNSGLHKTVTLQFALKCPTLGAISVGRGVRAGVLDGGPWGPGSALP